MKNTNSNIDETEEKEKISFLDLLIVVAKRWKLIFWISFGAALFSVIYSVISIVLPPEKSYLPNEYESKVVLLFSQNSSGSDVSSLLGEGGSSLLSLMGGAGLSETNPNIDILEILLQRNSTLDTLTNEVNLIEHYKLTEDFYPYQTARTILKENIKIDKEAKDGTISISYKSYNPEFAEKMILHIIDLLQVQYMELKKDQNTQFLSVINDNIAVAEGEMNAKLEEFSEFQKRTGIIEPTIQIETKSRITAALENSIIEKRLKLEEIASYRGYNDPQVTQVKKEISQAERALSMQIEGKGINSKYNLPLSELIKLAPEFNKLQIELEALQKLYISLRMQKQTKQLELSSEAQIFQIIEKPNHFTSSNGNILTEPPMKSGPSRAKLVILVSFASFFFSILLAFTLEFISQIKKDSEESLKLQEFKSYLPKLGFRRRKR